MKIEVEIILASQFVHEHCKEKDKERMKKRQTYIYKTRTYKYK